MKVQYTPELGLVTYAAGEGFYIGDVRVATSADIVPVPSLPTPVTFSDTLVFDLSAGKSYEVSQITSDFTIEIDNGTDGDEFSIVFKQSSGGGNVITDVTVPERSVVMNDRLVQLNTPNFLTASTLGILTGKYHSMGRTQYVFLDMETFVPFVL